MVNGWVRSCVNILESNNGNCLDHCGHHYGCLGFFQFRQTMGKGQNRIMTQRCPYLNDQELCSIYEQRFSCCGNFPNRNTGMYCSETTKCVYTPSGDLDCFNCQDKCCNHLDIPALTPVWQVVKYLSMDCDTCRELYCKE